MTATVAEKAQDSQNVQKAYNNQSSYSISIINQLFCIYV